MILSVTTDGLMCLSFSYTVTCPVICYSRVFQAKEEKKEETVAAPAAVEEVSAVPTIFPPSSTFPSTNHG